MRDFEIVKVEKIELERMKVHIMKQLCLFISICILIRLNFIFELQNYIHFYSVLRTCIWFMLNSEMR